MWKHNVKSVLFRWRHPVGVPTEKHIHPRPLPIDVDGFAFCYMLDNTSVHPASSSTQLRVRESFQSVYVGLALAAKLWMKMAWDVVVGQEGAGISSRGASSSRRWWWWVVVVATAIIRIRIIGRLWTKYGNLSDWEGRAEEMREVSKWICRNV